MTRESFVRYVHQIKCANIEVKRQIKGQFGPVEPATKDGFKYALSFVDDFTGTNMIYFLKQKSDTIEATEKFLADIAPFGKVKRIRSDNGTEFTSRKFKSLLRQNSIKHETSAPYSPDQNGTVE
jgi:transposase InsO family protein